MISSEHIPFNIPFSSFTDQKPGTSGLRKSTKQFQEENSNPKEFTEDQKKDYYTVLTLDQLDDLIVNLKSSNLISLDLETTSTNPSIAEIVGLSFSISKILFSIKIPFYH